MMNADNLKAAKVWLRIPALWRQLGLPGEPGKSCHSPWREDRNPSFSVFDDGLRFRDFATGDTGDAIDFLARARGLSNADACREFKKLAGVVENMTPASVTSPVPRRMILPALHVGTEAELTVLAALRHVSADGLRLASARGLLRFGHWRDRAAWLVTDGTGFNAQVRRLDGLPWPQGCKALTLPGSRAAWPLGVQLVTAFPIVLFCEGGPDFLAAHHFIAAEGRANDAAAVAMLGASLTIPPDALPHFHRKRVRFFTHTDKAGRAGVVRWARQLAQAGARLDAIALDGLGRADGKPAEDLNDLTRLHPEDLAAHPALQHLIPQV